MAKMKTFLTDELGNTNNWLNNWKSIAKKNLINERNPVDKMHFSNSCSHFDILIKFKVKETKFNLFGEDYNLESVWKFTQEKFKRTLIK